MTQNRLAKYTDDQLRSNRRALAVLQGFVLIGLLGYVAVVSFLLLSGRWKDNKMLGLVPLAGLTVISVPIHLQRVAITKEIARRKI